MSDTNYATTIDAHNLVVRLRGEVIEEKRLRRAAEDGRSDDLTASTRRVNLSSQQIARLTSDDKHRK